MFNKQASPDTPATAGTSIDDVRQMLGGLSDTELDTIKAEIDSIKVARKAQTEADFLAEMEAKAKELGLDLDALLKVKGKGKRAKSVAKYAHPSNPSKTWSGIGRKPQWVTAHLDGGGRLEDLAI